jgi:hypothetical protein
MAAPVVADHALNPWLSLPLKRPFVLEADLDAVVAFNTRVQSRQGGKYAFNLDLYPEPYFGDPFAPVVLLLANPGVGDSDLQLHKASWFESAARESLAHDGLFLHLRPGIDTPGARWWRRTTSALANVVNEPAVAKGLLCLEYIPYHSKAFGCAGLSLPSQRYTFDLLRFALRRDAYVVVMRARSLWFKAVPELAAYASSRVRVVGNPRNPTLSPANLGAAFCEVCELLRRHEGGQMCPVA